MVKSTVFLLINVFLYLSSPKKSNSFIELMLLCELFLK